MTEQTETLITQEPIAQWRPYRESLRTTLLRTISIAAGVGALIAWRIGALRAWPIATIIVLWPSLGGHYVEIFYLNFLHPRLRPSRSDSTRGGAIAIRLVVWFIGGIVLSLCMRLTAMLLIPNRVHGFHGPRPIWWIAGLGFIAIELTAHGILRLRGIGNFYDGRG